MNIFITTFILIFCVVATWWVYKDFKRIVLGDVITKFQDFLSFWNIGDKFLSLFSSVEDMEYYLDTTDPKFYITNRCDESEFWRMINNLWLKELYGN